MHTIRRQNKNEWVVGYFLREDGTLWVRPEAEFCDGRFIRENE